MFHYIASFFLDSNPGQLNVFEDSKDEYLVNLLDTGLNNIPASEQKFCAMSEQEFNKWLESKSTQQQVTEVQFTQTSPKRGKQRTK